MSNDNIKQILGNRQSEDAPQGDDSPVGLDGAVLGPQHDFRTAAIPAEMQMTRKDKEQGDPYAKPYRISPIFEVQPAGGSGSQFVAVAGEGNGRWSGPIDFEAHSLLVSNWSAQFVHFPTVNAWLAPWQVGAVITVPRGVTSIDLKFISPAGIATPAVVASHFAAVQAYEGWLAPFSGVDVTGLVGASAPSSARLIDSGGLIAASVLGGVPGDNAGFGNTLEVSSIGELWNTVGFDKWRSLSGVGDGLGVALASQPSSAPLSTISGANAAVTNTYTAVAGQQHRLTHRGSSYNAAATGRLTISDGATVIEDYDISAAGPAPLPPLPQGGIKGTVNTAMTVTLQAGGAAVIGRINSSKLTA